MGRRRRREDGGRREVGGGERSWTVDKVRYVNIFVSFLWNRLDYVSACSCYHEKALFIRIGPFFVVAKLTPQNLSRPENALPAGWRQVELPSQCAKSHRAPQRVPAIDPISGSQEVTNLLIFLIYFPLQIFYTVPTSKQWFQSTVRIFFI